MAMLKITQVHKVELGRPEEFDRPSSEEEALRRLEKRAGPKARKMLEDFLAKLEKLEPCYKDDQPRFDRPALHVMPKKLRRLGKGI